MVQSDTHTHTRTHTHSRKPTHTHTHTVSVSSASSDDSDGEEDQLYKKLEDIDDLEVDYLQATLIMEGPLKRKVLKRQGKSVSVSY